MLVVFCHLPLVLPSNFARNIARDSSYTNQLVFKPHHIHRTTHYRIPIRAKKRFYSILAIESIFSILQSDKFAAYTLIFK